MRKEIDFDSIRPIFEVNDIQFAGVFGSIARGDVREDSDVDILVRMNTPMSLLGLIRLENEISEKIGREVDLVTEDSLSPFIRKDVLQDLKEIYESYEIRTFKISA